MNTIICLTGLDGAGKTSHLKAIKRRFEKEGIRCKIVHLHGAVFRLFSLPLLTLSKSLGYQSEARHPLAHSNKALSFVWPWLFLVDFITFFLGMTFPYFFLKDTVLLFDRYVYDVIVDLMVSTGDTHFQEKTIFKLLLHGFRKPDFVALLDVDARIAYERKMREESHTLGYLQKRCLLYRRLASVLDIPVIVTSRPWSEAHDDIVEEMSKAGLVLSRHLKRRCSGFLGNLLLGSKDILGKVVDLTRIDVELLKKSAETNRVLIRSFARLARVIEDSKKQGRVSTYIKSILEHEENRVSGKLFLASRVARSFRREGINFVVMKSLDNFPDLGHDVDFLLPVEDLERAGHTLTEEFQAVRLGGTVCDRLVGKTSYRIPCYDSPIELYPSITQFGEYYLSTRSIIANAIPKNLGNITMEVPSSEDQILIACVHRMYRHFFLGIRLCDVVNIANLLKKNRINWEYIHKTAKDAGITRGLNYLIIFVQSVNERFSRRDDVALEDIEFPYVPRLGFSLSLFIEKFFKDVQKGRLSAMTLLLFAPLIFLLLITYTATKRNLVW